MGMCLAIWGGFLGGMGNGLRMSGETMVGSNKGFG